MLGTIRNLGLMLGMTVGFLLGPAFAQLQIGPSSGNPRVAPVGFQNQGTNNAPQGNLQQGNLQPPPLGNPGQGNPGVGNPVPNPLQIPKANPPAVAPESAAPTLESIAARQQQLQTSNDIEPAIKQALGQLLEACVAELRVKAENERLAKELATNAEAAPAATQDAKRRRENPSPPAFGLGERLVLYSIEELQKEIQSLQTKLQAIVDQRTRVESAITTRESRRKELPRLTNEEKELQRKIGDELALPPSPEIDARLSEAQRLLALSKRDASLERVRKMEAELRAYDAEAELLPLRKELFIGEEKLLQARIKEIADELNKRRESLIQTEKQKLEQLAKETSGTLKSISDRLVKRSNDWLELAKANSTIQLEMEAAKARKTLWAERYKIMKERIDPTNSKEVGSFNSLVGLMLRRQRSELPDPARLQAQLREYEKKMVQTETLILDLDDSKAKLTAVEQGGTWGDSLSDPNRNVERTDTLMGEEERLRAAEKELITNFRVDAANYFDNLFALAGAKRDTINLVHDYRDFVDQHILWIRSSETLDGQEAKNALPALQWLCDIGRWRSLGRSFLNDTYTNAWGSAIAFLLGIGLITQISKIRRRIGTLGEQALRTNHVSYRPTALTVVLSVLAASPIALFLAFVGWRLKTLSVQPSFEDAIGYGVLAAARYFFSLELLRQICRKGGLADAHFQWSERTTQILRSNLRWLIDLGVPTVTLVAILSRAGEEKWESSLGRILFCTLMLLCGTFLFRVLRPKNGVFTDYLERNDGGWFDRLRYLWYFGVSSGPLVLAALSFMGYHYTAHRLAIHFHTSIISLTALLLVQSLLRRWFLLSRRKILVSQARQRLEEAAKRDPATANSLLYPASQVDLAEINAQTLRLVSSVIMLAAIGAVAFIWSGVLPAVGVLNAIELWKVSGPTPNSFLPITLANVLLAIPIMAMTIVAARNLPGLLEIALLQHLPLENAVRYAIATLSRYAIFVLGIAMTFNSIGVRWANVQWLVAALGVGLGFGLQEIFANFISGLILLFEQPIRVGDVITLGETTGSVSKIRMRATTIINWDRQELIIPNKDLITGRLLNWTLSDSTNRLKLHIGVAYGTDTDLACKILQEICQKHPNVLKEPLPTAIFENFGDNSLDLTVRLFLANLDTRLQTRHELHTQFAKAFADAEIEIAFPQRDLHIRSLPASLMKVLSGNQEPAGVQAKRESA